jgi:muramidase (phage lysozyme)
MQRPALALLALGGAALVAAWWYDRQSSSAGVLPELASSGFADWFAAPAAAAAPSSAPLEAWQSDALDMMVANPPPLLVWDSILADPVLSTIPQVVHSSAGAAANRAAFLALIRQFESGDRYNVIYGGDTFDSYADHPRIYVPINLPGYEGKSSSAAGAYQFLWATWDNLRNRLGLPDFSPPSQDAAALELLRQVGALAAIDAGDFDTAMRAASSQWASLPYSTAQQNPQTIAKANVFLAAQLGADNVA